MKHQDLEVWNKAIKLVTDIYIITKNYPKDEIYALTSQMRRCAVSIPSNIAEGCARFSDKETLKFLSIVMGSISELETQIISQISSVKKLILGLVKYLNTKTEQI